jgi:hypothetical protein
MLNWADMLGSGFDYKLHFDRKKIQESLEGNLYDVDHKVCDFESMWNFKHAKNAFAGQMAVKFHTNPKDDISHWLTVSNWFNFNKSTEGFNFYI